MRAKRNVLATLAVLSTVGALMTLPASAEAGAVSSRGTQGWTSLGRVADRQHNPPVVATSSSGVVALVAPGVRDFEHPRAKSLVILRLPNGDRRRASVDIGELVGLAVDRQGDTTVVGSRRGAVVALTWLRHKAHPSLGTLLAADRLPDPFDAQLQRNGAGDLAIFVRPYPQDDPRVAILRKPHGQRWLQPLLIAPGRYDATLDDIALRSNGSILGAFRHDHVVERRTLPASGGAFQAPHVLIEWPEISEVPGAHGEISTVDVGAGGDLVASLSYTRSVSPDRARRDAEAGWFRIVVEPREGEKWRHEIAQTVDFPRFVVDRHGDVSMFRGTYLERWSPETRELKTYENTLFKAQNPRGDLLVGTLPYRGTLSLWPSGGVRGAAMPSPRGDFMSAFLGQDRVAHVTTLDRTGVDAGSYLWRHQF
jgi:hypothetical protein